jgi:hypothetical protein
MSKFLEKVALYMEDAKKIGIKVDEAKLTLVTKGLGPSIYKADASTVAGSDKAELERIKANFLIKTMGTANRNKHRALVYYLLAEKFNKFSVYSK